MLQAGRADEFDVKIGHISADSPVAKALLGKNVDDEVRIKRPAGELIDL
jgi:transcription elongation factor GreB